MAKAKEHTKPETVSLREIYAAELARFYPSAAVRSRINARQLSYDDMLIDPALRVVREKLKRQPYRYLDRDKAIRVVQVMHGARDLETLLDENV